MSKARNPDQQELAQDIADHEEDIFYSPRYSDDLYEYRHVIVPKQLARWLPQGTLMADAEWRSYGIKQSPGWVHYMVHAPEPHILLFRREKDYQAKYGSAAPLAESVGGLAG